VPSAADRDLDLTRDLAGLTADLIDVPSESFSEGPLADAVERALRAVPHLRVTRLGNTIVARTDLGRAQRVVIGGHLDTVPAHDNLPHRLVGDRLYGLGACDMKGGVAVALRLAALIADPVFDVTYLFYDCEEVASEHNGLAKLADAHPDLLAGDFAILMEPSNARVEAGCQGTLRVEVTATGTRAHSARSWMGDNAIHHAAAILDRLDAYQAAEVEIDGLVYREGLNAVRIHGGVAGNVIPDRCVVTVNYRYAPNVTAEAAEAHVAEVFDGFEVVAVDNAPGALPGLNRAAVASFVAAVGEPPHPKYGWTDVARFTAVGVPALNFGPGDPSLAHTQDEFVPLADLTRCEHILSTWLTGGEPAIR
jgi:succinyl-diaminopimelate desuccinylase